MKISLTPTLAFTALCDTGCSSTVISYDAFCQLPAKLQTKLDTSDNSAHFTVNNDSLETIGTLPLSFKLPNVAAPFTFAFTVIKNINYPVILGYNFFEAQDVKIFPRQRAMFYQNHRIPFLSDSSAPGSASISAILTVGRNYKIRPGTHAKIFVSRPDVAENTFGLISGLPVETGHSIGHATVSQGLTKIPSPDAASIPVIFSNLTPTMVFLKKGMPLATFYKLAEENIDYCNPATGEEVPIVHLPPDVTDQINELSGSTPQTPPKTTPQTHDDHPVFRFTTDPSITPENKEKLRRVLEKYSDIFSTNDFEISRAKMEPIQLDVGSAKPVCLRPLKSSEFQKQEIKKHVQNFLKAGILKRSTSAWAAPCFVVNRPGSTADQPRTRLVISYVKLNSLIRKQTYPMPNFETVLNFLAGGHYFSTVDCRNAFHSLPLSPQSQPLTAFVTPHMGKFEWSRCPMGINVGPAIYSGFIDTVLQDSPAAMSYMDDVIVRSPTQESHIMHIEDTLVRLQRAGLTLNPAKCNFFQKSVRFLGYKFSKDGCTVLPEKIEAIACMPPPQNKKGVRSFLGFINYYAGFIKHFSSKAAPLTDLLRTNRKFEWKEEQQDSFNLLKEELKHAVTISYPQLDKITEASPLHLYCDGSNTGLSGVLSQQIDGKEHILGIHSKKFTPQQQRLWTVSEKELFAIVSSVKRFAHILHRAPLRIFTDHKSILNLLCKSSSSPRLARWSQYLSTFAWGSPNIFGYIRGIENPADFLSRTDAKTTDDAEPEIGIPSLPPPLMHQAPSDKPPTKHISINSITSPKAKDSDAPSVLGVLHPQRDTFETPLLPPGVSPYPLSTQQLATLQANDPDFQKIIAHLKDPSQPAPQLGKLITACFHLGKDNELYYDTAHSARTEVPTVKIAVPKSLRNSIISLSHDPFSHNSANVTFRRVAASFYWPRAQLDCKEYVANCLICTLRSPKTQKQSMGHIPVPARPNEALSIDVLHLPKSKEGFTRVLGIVDEFTGYLSLYPLLRETSEAIADVLLTQHIPLHGFFKQIRSDNAATNCSKVLSHIYNRLGIQHRRSSPFTSQGNPLIERKFRDVQNLLSKSTQPDITAWPRYLAQTCFSLNTATSKTSQFSPFYLTHGYEATLPADLLFSNATSTTEAYTLPTSLEYLTSNLVRAKNNIIKKRQLNEKAYNQRFQTTFRTFEAGTPVALKIENFPSILDAKLSMKYQPGFVVTRQISNHAVEIAHSLTGAKKAVNIAKLRKMPLHTSLLPETDAIIPKTNKSSLTMALDLPPSTTPPRKTSNNSPHCRHHQNPSPSLK